VSAINRLLAGGEQVLLSTGHKDKMRVASGQDIGKIFYARIDVEPVIQLNSDLEGDQRMQSVLRILPRRNKPIPRLEKHDEVVQLENNSRWRILKRESNPASITQDFWIEQITI
jgi:hypothetical protein